MAIPFIQGPKIAAGQSLSDVIDCSTSPPVRITMPSGWTAPAHLTFQVSSDGVTFGDLVDNAGQEIRVNVVPNTVVRLSAQWITSPVLLRFRSGSSAVPIVQAADRIFGCAMMNDQTGSVGPEGPQGPPGPQGTPGPAGPSAASANPGNLAKLGTDSLILVPNTSALKGTVAGDDAAPGMIGEVIKGSNPTGISLANNVPTNLITLHLTPGDWNVGSITTFTPAGTGPNGLASGITLTSGTLPTDPEITSGVGILNQLWASSMPSNKVQNIPTSLVRVNTSAPKDVFLVVMAAFGGGTVTATGYMSARRIR
jgi:hypothetical protein